MRIILTQPLKISDQQTLPVGLEIDFEESTARDLIKAGKAKRVRLSKEDRDAAARQTKPDHGPTETK